MSNAKILFCHILLSLLFAVPICCYYSWQPMYICRFEFILNAAISIAATFSGFILTSLSIMVTLSETKLMKAINKGHAKSELYFRVAENITVAIALIVLFLAAGAIVNDTNHIPRLAFFFGLIILSYYFLSLLTSCYYLLSIISFCSDSDDTNSTPSSPRGKYRC